MIQAGQREQASLTESEIDRVLRKVAIPRHWHTESIKRGRITRSYIEVHELEEIISAVLYSVRSDMESALVGIFRDTCPERAKLYFDVANEIRVIAESEFYSYTRDIGLPGYRHLKGLADRLEGEGLALGGEPYLEDFDPADGPPSPFIPYEERRLHE